MALPTSYLTSSKNLEGILGAIQQAKAPGQFTTRFLESLEYKSSSDRLVIGVLKSLRLLDDQGRPTPRYFTFLDQTQSAAVLAEGIREAFADLFAVNVNAHTLGRAELINKFKTLSQGTLSESVLDKLAMTFLALVKLADFSAPPAKSSPAMEDLDEEGAGGSSLDEPPPDTERKKQSPLGTTRSLGGLHYNIQIVLPETRDAQVYDALFRSLKEHLSL